MSESAHIWDKDDLLQEYFCPLCHSNSFTKIFIRADSLPLHECGNCRFVYLGLRPNQQALTNYYESNYFENSPTYNHYFNYAEAVTDLNYCPRLMRLSPYLHDLKGKAILEIGCAAGSTLELIRRQGGKVKGIEISAQAAAIAVNHYDLEVIHTAFKPSLLTEEQYDIIMLFDVLEHLPNPGNVLDELTKALTQTGYLVLTVPNFNRFDQIGAKWSGVLSYWEHLHFFRTEVLRKSLEQRGFSIVNLHSFTSPGQNDKTKYKEEIRTMRHSLTNKFPFIRQPVRLLRKARFKLCGPPPLPKSPDYSGMDLFCLAQKGLDGVSKL